MFTFVPRPLSSVRVASRWLALSCLAALAFGCSKSADHDGAVRPLAESPEIVRELVNRYDAVRALLVKDQGAEVAAAAKALHQATDAALRQADPASRKQLEAIATQAEALAAVPATELARMREHFGEISRPLVTLLESAPSLSEGYHVFECPMAEGYGRWVQVDTKLANPYMGTSMPECGSEKQWPAP
ncbi:DUF3347 domain-containing protein [Haliangium sp.]|uniref:DUF3347 domain-containing protein n=1 Tax=Haliangium sp. TaxID=2663208 RepID=UPI003D09D45C